MSQPDDYYPSRSRLRRKKSRIFFAWFLILPMVFSLSFYLLAKSSAKQKTLVSPLASTPLSETLSATSISKNEMLEKAVHEGLKESFGKYGVVIKHLDSGEGYYLNENRVFEPASLYKLWIMVVTMQQLEVGKLKEDQVLSADVKVLNDTFKIASESAEKTEGKVTYTVSEALERMITVSDNYAALLLSQKVRLSNVREMFRDYGFTASKVGNPPKSTAYEIATFLEKIYRGEFADKDHTKQMMDLLKRQRLNNKLPKYLPKGIVIAHKTGELGWFTHDAGIVYTDSGNYILVLMSESNLPYGAEERIAQISRNVFEYFTTGQ